MSSKAEIEQAKAAGDTGFFRAALSPANEERTLLFVLNKLGRLPAGFDASALVPLVQHPNENVRLAAVKNLGKIKDETLLMLLCEQVFRENSTLVRREMASAIGRMRNRNAIPTLGKLLRDADAKVILQAVRALLCFKKEEAVREMLRPLAEHSHELVRAVIQKEFTGTRASRGKQPGHAQSPDAMKNVLVQGDAREIMRFVPDESVHLTFTSPPYYNARDYTLYRSYDDYLAFLGDVFTEVHRITKEGRFFVLNTSPVLIPRMGRNHASARYLIPFDIHPILTKIGFEFIDDLIWLKPEPSAKNRNGGFFQHRKPLGYKANSVCEYVIVYRKKTDKLIDWNMKQYDAEAIEASKVRGDYDKSNAWKIAPSSDRVHSAVFPKELASRIIQFYSYKGDLVFDPFAGSGTVGQVALKQERRFFLTEQDQAYAEYAFQQLSTGSLLSEHHPRLLTTQEFAVSIRVKD